MKASQVKVRFTGRGSRQFAELGHWVPDEERKIPADQLGQALATGYFEHVTAKKSAEKAKEGKGDG